MYHNSMLML